MIFGRVEELNADEISYRESIEYLLMSLKPYHPDLTKEELIKLFSTLSVAGLVREWAMKELG